MNDVLKTVLAVLLAAALGFAAWFLPDAGRTPEEFSDLGQQFSPAFSDPLSARSLEVVALDERSAAYKAFKVEHDGTRWVIPSHHNYPADAATKMAEAASAFIGLTKEQVVADSPARHAELGVLAPDDDKAPIKGRGVRVIIRGEGGATLSDLIIGDEVAPTGANETGQPGAPKRYVRVPGQARVYAASLKAGLSTRFDEWIETDLLQLAGAQVARVDIYRGAIDETTGTKKDAEHVAIRRAPAAPGVSPGATGWTATAEPGGPPTELEEIKAARIDELIAALRGIRIVGVRPKPANLAKALGGTEAGVRVNATDILNLQSRGFYLSQDGRMLANEGELTVGCDDGVVYTLWFGEIAPGGGEALSAGLEAESPAESPEAPQGEARHLFVTVTHDESLLGPAPTPPETTQPPPDSTPEAIAAATAADEAAKAAYDAQVAARDQKLKAGRDRAAALGKRFADWWYVIDGASFDRLRPTRAEVIGLKAAAPGAAPGVPPPSGEIGPAIPPG